MQLSRPPTSFRRAAEFQENIAAPFVKESSVKYTLTLQQIIPITLNDTFLVIGKVTAIHLDAAIVSADGFLHPDKADTICCNGSDRYYTADPIGHYIYAKLDVPLKRAE